ncbi:MAG: RraA family protein [Acidimicrobiales bacterium]
MSFVARLRALDTGAVSDACDRLGLVDRVSTSIASTTGSVRIGGRAVTVLLGPPDGASPSARHLCAAATDSATADDVIVVDHQRRTDCAGWGGNLSRAARNRGVAATIVDGAVRDVDEAIEVGYPVFACGSTPRTARGRAEEKTWGEPVSVDGIVVATGDYVLGDSSGIVFIAAADIEPVLEAAEAITTKEAAMAAAIESGRPVSDVMGADYETMLDDPGDRQ